MKAPRPRLTRARRAPQVRTTDEQRPSNIRTLFVAAWEAAVAFGALVGTIAAFGLAVIIGFCILIAL